MKKLVSRLASTLLAVGLLAATATSVHAQSGTPQDPYIITAPTVLNKAGYYRLGNNIATTDASGIIIQVNANNVTLDLNGFYIAGPKNTASNLYGVDAYEKSNVSVINGTVAYCFIGVHLTGNNSATTNNVNHRVRDLRVTYCTYIGIEVDYAPSTLIEHNQVSQTGGTSATTGTTFGIFFQGSGGTITGNVVTKVSPAANGSAANGGAAYGISAGTASYATRNTVSNCTYGVYCQGKFQDNLTYGCNTAYGPSYADAGGNN